MHKCAAQYVERVCALLDAEQAADVRLGASVVLDLKSNYNSSVLTVTYRGVELVRFWRSRDIRGFIDACRRLGWQYKLDEPEGPWAGLLSAGPVYKEVDGGNV